MLRRLSSGLVPLIVSSITLAAGCAAPPDAPVDVTAGPHVDIRLAALNLSGVGDAVWDLEVRNGADAIVWQRRLSSSGYGDGAGSASYIGTCDASTGVDENTVRVWVVGAYSSAVSDAGEFASGGTTGDGAVTGAAIAFQNPTTTGPLEQTFVCLENGDVAVQFDVALMRPAQQGFFDIAVNFNDIFCSAKFDCCYEGETPGCQAGEQITLLFDAGGARSDTMVLGFACTAGTAAGVDTQLYLDDVALDCTDPSGQPFSADIALDPSGDAGNQCSAGDLASCAGVVTGGATADTYLFQYAVYRGVEDLPNVNKVYWNVALGVKRPAIAGCRLRTRGTAADGNDPAVASNGEIADGAVYPYLQWDVDLGTCASEPLTFGDPAAMVRTSYTGTGDTGTSFTYGYGPSLPAGRFTTPPTLYAVGSNSSCQTTCDTSVTLNTQWGSYDVEAHTADVRCEDDEENGFVAFCKREWTPIGTDMQWQAAAPDGQDGGVFQRDDGSIWRVGYETGGVIAPLGTGTDFAAIIGGHSGSFYALGTDGGLYGMGRNTYTRLGDTLAYNDEATDWFRIESATWDDAAIQFKYGYGLQSDGTIWGIGYNSGGYIGPTNETVYDHFVQVGSSDRWVAMAAGASHAYAIRDDGTIWGIGRNSSYQTGGTSTSNKTSFTQIGGDSDWVEVTAGEAFGMARKSDGSVWGIGANTFAQLGGGPNRSAWTQIADPSMGFVEVQAGKQYAWAMKADGSIWGIGYNGYGVLGDEATNDYACAGGTKCKSTWTQVGTESGFTQMVAAEFHGYALK